MEKTLVKSPSVYKVTDVSKFQVNRIRLLERLKLKHKASRSCDQEISRLEELEFGEEVTPDNLDLILSGERQHLKQLQDDIDLHLDEHL